MDEPTCSHEANSLLPWYLNGSLAGEEEAAVRAHLQSCAVCAAELDALVDTAKSLSEREWTEAESRALPSLRPPGRAARPWLRYAAAALFLPAVLGLYWIYLGLPGIRGAPDARGELRPGVLLDLGAGPSRDGSSPPSLHLDPKVDVVTFSLVVPSGAGSSYTLELRDGEDRLLATHGAPPARDLVGRVLYTVETSLLGSGEHSLTVRDMDPAASDRSYRYPFRVYRQSPAATKAPQKKG